MCKLKQDSAISLSLYLDSVFKNKHKLVHNQAPVMNRLCPFLTLSKILCKWKQDSAVSIFLYLDSVFKYKHKLVHNQSPAMNRLCPFLLNLHKWKIDGLFDSIIRREWDLLSRIFYDLSVQTLNEIGCVNYFPDFQRKLEEDRHVIPIVSPWKYGYFPPHFFSRLSSSVATTSLLVAL